MNKQRIFRRSGEPLRARAGPTALIIFGLDNVGALEDLFGEPLGDEIIDAVQARIAPALPAAAKLWRAEHRRIALSIPQLDRDGVSALVSHLQATIAHRVHPVLPIETLHRYPYYRAKRRQLHREIYGATQLQHIGAGADTEQTVNTRAAT